MKLVVDVNLSPAWVGRLAARGFDAVHWSTVGTVTAEDQQILSWAKAEGWVLLTNDLDFSAILASTGDDSPSVVQLRRQDLMSEAAVNSVVAAATAYSREIGRGALLSVDESGARVRLLPLRGR
jgi:predicted nuclease of predicted toxin-antitoxin system